MELKKAVHLVKIIGLKQATSDYIKIDKEDAEAIDTVLEELNNRISKEILEEYLKQAEEGYKTYKKASKENEGCKGGMWRYLGQVDVLKRILGKSIKIVTLDKE